MSTSPFPLRAALAALCLAAPAAHASTSDTIDPVQTQTCNEPPALARGGGVHAAGLTGKPLPPGAKRKTEGTNATDSPELDGLIVISQTSDFSFGDGLSLVAGKYTEIVSQGTDGFCKCHVQVAVMKGCIAQVSVRDVVHDNTLVADWRTDFPGHVPSRKVQRSLPDGENKTRVTFTMNEPVCEGFTSRFLLLNTNVNQLALGNTLQFKSPANVVSPAFPFRVPMAP